MKRDFERLNAFIAGREIDHAKQIIGLTDGNDAECHQPCPICGGKDRFYVTDGKRIFHCRRCGLNGDLINLVAKVKNISLTEAFDIIAEAAGYSNDTVRSESPKPIDVKSKLFRDGTLQKTEYIYGDEEGIPRHKVNRIDGIDDSTGEPGKIFSQWKKQDGEWVKGAPALTFPYRLPEVLLVGSLFIVEGEKTADCLNRVLLESGTETAIATTSPMGAQNGLFWKEYLQRYPTLTEKKIIILPDNDEPGRKYAWTIAAAVLEANPETRVKIVDLPDMSAGGDFVDWYVEMEQKGEDNVAIIQKLRGLCKNVVPLTVEDVTKWVQSNTVVEPPKQRQSFPLETLPSGLRQYVKQVSQSIGIDSAYVAASVLSIVSGIIGRTFEIEVKKGYREHAMLWVAVVADSGLGKSPALKHPRQPIDRLEREGRQKYKEDCVKYESQSTNCSDEQSSENNEDSTKQKIITAPVMQRYIVSDATTAALVPLLADNPYGLCLIRDEIGAFMGAIDAHSKNKSEGQFYIELHGGISIVVDRKTGQRHIAADTPSLSIIGGIQSDILRRTLVREPDFLSTGFAARFLMIYPPPIPVYWNHNEISDDVLLPYEQLIENLVGYRESISPSEPGIVRLTPEADNLIYDFQNRQADKTLDIADGNVRYVQNKAGMHAARLALVLHVVECTEKGFTLPSSVPEKTMQRAITLTEWFLNEAHRIYAMLSTRESASGGKLVVSNEALILAKIQQKGSETTVRDLRKSMSSANKYRQEKGAEELTKKLREMVKAGLLVIRHEGKKELFCLPDATE